jgi:signal transduction histidine kinase
MTRTAAAAAWPGPALARVPRSLSVSIIGAAGVMAAGLVLRAAGLAGGLTLGVALLPLLFAAGGVCSAALLRRRSPSAAWFGAGAAGAIGAIEVVGLVRAVQGSTGPRDWPLLVAVAELALAVAATIAALYAVRGRRDPTAVAGRSPGGWVRAWQGLSVLGLVAVGFGVVWAISDAATAAARVDAVTAAGIDIWPVRASGRIALGYIAIAALGGVLRDALPVARRAWVRSPGVTAFPRALGDQLLPTSTAMRRRGEEDERARLAADLHARVLPDLRRAAAAAAAGGDASQPVHAGLREAIEGVEQLMHSRQSIVLEQYGLVAALEWLAERTQQRSRLEVLVELDGAGVDDPAAAPKPVARAAFRVALLATDNVERHANAARVRLRLAVDGSAVDLAIADDGTGFDGDTAPSSGRGLVDMRMAAVAVGATVTVQSGVRGTLVAFRWSPAAHLATRQSP